MRSVIFINVTISIGGLYGFRPKQEYIHLPTRLHIRYQPEQELGKQQAGH